MNTIYLEPAMVPATLRAGYDGKKYKACVCEDITIPATAGLWEGGSRYTYRIIRLDDGRMVDAVNHNAAPWNGARRDYHVKLEPGIVVVEHSIFCGKDMGLTFYVHPHNATALLPAPVELNRFEKLVLKATQSFKSSYMGRDRYQMMREDYRYGRTIEGDASFPTRAQWDEAKAALIVRGFLNKAGAITVSGRNAVKGR